MRVLDRKGRRKVPPGFPVGGITAFAGAAIPSGWLVCDGTNGTPNLIDRFVVGAAGVGLGVAAGSTSPTAVLTHTGADAANHSDHVVTQPAAHSNHVVTQPSAHSAHGVTQPAAHGTHSSVGGHTHDAHTTATRTAAGVAADVTTPPTHASQGAHTHDAHSAHAGMAVDAHSAHAGAAVDAHSAHVGATVDAHSAHAVTQSTSHAAMAWYALVYLMYVGAAVP